MSYDHAAVYLGTLLALFTHGNVIVAGAMTVPYIRREKHDGTGVSVVLVVLASVAYVLLQLEWVISNSGATDDLWRELAWNFLEVLWGIVGYRTLMIVRCRLCKLAFLKNRPGCR